MSPFKKYFLVGIVVVAGIVAIYAYREFNRKPTDLATVTAQKTVTVANLVASYEADEAAANKEYLGKTILVSGNIAEINNQQDTLLNVLLGNADNLHGVSCLLDIKQLEEIKHFHVGDSIAIKGICTGYLADVELNRCVIIQDK